ncbi:protein S100-G-like [Boleophthalmus pectinirostris]|uniref:protein S100-G-like n=1 Tax=Boleophthalmus pectinirostris TaxID=150288 RepID=UPI000A1C41A0|nr:protein S100-G-like [Boleophthalmus pectinirostris]
MCDLGGKVGDLKKAFDEYAGREGDPNTLTKRELKAMIQDKMGPALKDAKCPDKLDKIFECMDKNGDGEVDFAEFMQAIGMLMSAVHGWHAKGPKS